MKDKNPFKKGFKSMLSKAIKDSEKEDKIKIWEGEFHYMYDTTLACNYESIGYVAGKKGKLIFIEE